MRLKQQKLLDVYNQKRKSVYELRLKLQKLLDVYNLQPEEEERLRIEAEAAETARLKQDKEGRL